MGHAHFVDPFNNVRGVAPIQAIFRHMFTQLEAPRFAVTERFVRRTQVVLIWTLHCRLAGQPVAIAGASHLRLNAAGRVCMHRDFWDAANEVYEKLPLIG
ncbi:nuclear transport factor 2 family protein [Denitromonas sp.]|uniref:nuclear transport factor 2 family protein n=1 Tax=Denitromonas sp. TaxID=2734609 RepID=UPI003A889822